MFFSHIDTCTRCEKKVSQFNALKAQYRGRKGYDMCWAVLHCRRHGFSLRRIADILNRDIEDVKWAWDILKQQAR